MTGLQDMCRIAFDECVDVALPLPKSSLYLTRYSSVSGRGIFATKLIENGTLLLHTDSGGSLPIDENMTSSAGNNSELHSPIAHTILREYRKEVCGQCFAYDRGREWKVKLQPLGLGYDEIGMAQPQSSLNQSPGIVFCTDACMTTWQQHNGEIGAAAFKALEDAVRRVGKRITAASRRVGSTQEIGLEADSEVRDTTSHDKHLANNNNGDAAIEPAKGTPDSPSIENIQSAWCAAAQQAKKVVAARQASKPSKTDKKLLRIANEPAIFDGDLCFYLLTGTINTYVSAKVKSATQHGANLGAVSCETKTQDAGLDVSVGYSHDGILPDEAVDESITTRLPFSSTRDLLSSLLTLAPDTNCYSHPSSTLSLYTASFMLLQAILPLSLLPYLTPDLAHELNSRASHNAFSIRPSEQSDGDQSGEFMGWGVWPAASFFNHSCAPNVGKRRRGRHWEFYADGYVSKNDQAIDHVVHIEPDDELCITYLGGDERDLGFKERRKRLFEGWGFQCMCVRCLSESQAIAVPSSRA